jgi:undecaprenyl-diphosphatase
MDSLTQILILAVIQGVAEFLPISSSGHLVVAAALLAGGDSQRLEVADVNIVLHAGTLLSILVFYWHRVWRLLLSERRTAGLVLLASVPAGLVGVTIKLTAEELIESPLLAGFMLIATGLMLLFTARLPRGWEEYGDMSWGAALWIGVSQALAILPGISRSGATICTGLAMGLTRESAATFSFLIAIPAIGGAALLEIVELSRQATLITPLSHLALGAAVSFVVGLVSLSWLVRILRGGGIYRFAWWCIPLGLAVVVWQLVWL